MSWGMRRRWVPLAVLSGLATAMALSQPCNVLAREDVPPLQADKITTDAPPVPVPLPTCAPGDRPLPISLPVALQLANARPIDVAVASERIRLAVEQLERAEVLWLPSLQVGTDYYRHDGRIQETAGNVFDVSRSSFMVGAAPTAVFAISEALYEPLAARQVARARRADLAAATNDSLLAVAEAYFNVQQARGELAGAEDTVHRAAALVEKVDRLASPRFKVEVVALSELSRARAELARRRQAVQTARERWRVASADLIRLLRLDAPAVVEPLEPPHLRVTLIPLEKPLDDLIPLALTNRPELASQQALVQATIERLQLERVRPLIPSVLLRGASTNPAGTLTGGVFGGGRNESLNNFAARGDFDVQVLWEFQNLGFGNRARINERRAEHQLSVLELFRIQDRVAAEVVQAYAQAQSGAARVPEAESELKEALDSFDKNVEGMRQTKEGAAITLFNRPQEVVAALQVLAQAYSDYYGAVGDYNRGQFRLYRALGQPAQMVCPTNCSPSSTRSSGKGVCTPE